MRYRTRLAALLKAKGMTRLDIVTRTTMPYMSIRRWETELLDEIDPRYLEEVLRVLQCKVEELVYTVEEAKAQETRSGSASGEIQRWR